MPIQPVTTGVPDLDALLGGGLTQNALVLFVGRPGAGKTILASQILFHAVQHGTPTLLLTTHAEGQTKILEHLRPFRFFDEQVIGSSLTLLSLPSLVGSNIDTAAGALSKAIRESGAQMVLLDGIQGLNDQFQDSTATRRLLATLATMLSYLNVTLLVTLTGLVRDVLTTQELITADVVLGLEFGVDNWRHTRRIEVLKQRGRAHLAGFHSYTITGDGVRIVPRLEARPISESRPRPHGRVPFALSELDQLLGGGVTAGTTTLLIGAPGVGKTTLALYWSLAADKVAGASIFLSFDERLTDLDAKATIFGMPLQSALESNAFTFLFLSPVELDPDAVAARLLAAITPQTTRIVIDNFLVLVRSLGSRAYDYVTALRSHLYAAGVTTMILVEITPFAGLQVDVEQQPWGLLADNIVIVQQVVALGAIRRMLAVLKMRLSAYDATLRELTLDEQGIHVLTPPESAQGVLAATAGITGLTAPPASSDPA